jgi:hypothetical protein
MGTASATQSSLQKTMGLHKVKVARNTKRQPHGTRAYLRSLNRYQFDPTMPGPYNFWHFDAQGKAVKTPADPKGTERLLGRKTMNAGDDGDDDDEPTKVEAKDYEHDALYLCESTQHQHTQFTASLTDIIFQGEVEIGTPPQKMQLDFDTGSADL